MEGRSPWIYYASKNVAFPQAFLTGDPAADPAAEVHTPLCRASYPTVEELGQQQTLFFCQKHNMHKIYFEGMNTKA